MNQFEINQSLLAEAIKLHYKDYRPADAIAKIDLVLQTDKNSFAYSLKATILRELNKAQDALNVIEDGLGHNLRDHILLKLKAEILANNFFRTKEALPCIQQSQIFFEESNRTLKDFIKTLPGYSESEYLTNYLGTKAELKILESDIKHLDNTLFVLDKAKTIETQLISERVRTIELLGVFTAILAFIFSSIQIVTKLAVPDALILVTGIALLLISFLLVLHMVLDPTARTKHLITILVIIVLVLVGLPWYAKKLSMKENSVPHQVNIPLQKQLKK